jgi:AI-2 transport protein TqsA
MQNLRTLTIICGIIALFCIGIVLMTAKAVVLPLIIAWLLSYILGPVVKFLVRQRVPSGLAVFMVLLLVIGFFYLTGFFVRNRVMVFIGQYENYASQLNLISTDIFERFNISEEYLRDFDWTGNIGKRVMAISGEFMNLISNMGMVLIFLVFMLLGRPFSQNKINAAFPPKDARKITEVMTAITSQISRYLTIKLIISAITGLMVWIALTIIGVDFPVTWAVLTFLLNFIPTVGSIVATIPPVLIAMVQFYPNLWTALFVLIILLVIQQTMGSFIEPKLAGSSLNLSPVVILLSLVFWGWLWGVTGAILSVPIASAIKITCENIELLKPVSVLMGSGKNLRPFEGGEL